MGTKLDRHTLTRAQRDSVLLACRSLGLKGSFRVSHVVPCAADMLGAPALLWRGSPHVYGPAIVVKVGTFVLFVLRDDCAAVVTRGVLVRFLG